MRRVENRLRQQRREDRRAVSAGGGQVPWQIFRNPLSPLALLSEAELDLIDDVALRVLEELGLEFQNRESLDILEREGAKVDRSTGMVRFDRGLIRELVAKAPERFPLYSRNPDRTLDIGGNAVSFAPVGGPPNVSDLDRGRRPGTFEAQCELIRLHQSLNCLHHAGSPAVEAIDLPVENRHLDFYWAQLVYSDRPWNARGIGRRRVEDAIEMVALARGRTREALLGEPSLSCVINVNSPRRVDNELLAGLMAMAEAGQMLIITPFTLAGAMSPVTIAGSLAQQTAEALGVIAFAQMVRPGAPVAFGGFTSNVDMKSGAPAFGTPEYVRGVIIGGQVARRWKLPYRSSSVTSSNVVDTQAATESMMSLWAAIMSHANLIMHATGWLEGGLVASFEKSIIDADMISAMTAWLQPLDMSAAALGFEAIAATPPGGHFFGAAHTLERFQTAFHQSMTADLRPFQTWAEDGAKTATERANRIWKSLLANYEPPPMDPAVREALDDFVARRKREIAGGINRPA
ncbi:MAG TPA: trimethylamine methyltransferase family protein [Dongiaceae bacterium]|jgi:trimethylamine--corrinoid protein Co-methyltransferase|nr:trimethylamine methyltransferase family protein [Dongiaceae bacterium]